MPSELGSFILAEVSRAEADFAGNRARAVSIVGFTGGIVGLVSGLIAVAGANKKDIFPACGPVILAIALVAFVASTIVALCVNLASTVTAADMTAIKGFVQSDWDDEEWDKEVADLYADYVLSLRKVNGRNATLTNVAVGCEIVGIVFISVMTVMLVWHLMG